MRTHYKLVLVTITLLTSILMILPSSGFEGNVNRNHYYTNEILTNETVWQDLTREYNLVDPIILQGTGNLTIINSNITINGPDNGIEVQSGASLTIIDSYIKFNGTDHTIFGNTNGKITLNNASLQSSNGDAAHFEGPYELNIVDSTFHDSGDDGLHVEANNIPFNVTGSYFLNNGDDGFDLLEVSATTRLENSTLLNNVGHAVKGRSSGDMYLKDLVIDGQGGDPEDPKRGIDVEVVSLITIEAVSIHNFLSDGIKIRRSPAIIIDTIIENSGDEGIEVENTVSDNAVNIYNTTIRNAAGGDGIKIEGVVGNVFFNHTRVFDSADDGIQVTKGNATVYVHNTKVTTSFEDGFEIDSTHFIKYVNVTSQQNTENGLKFKNVNQVQISDSLFVNNGLFGTDGVNVTSITFESVNSSSNNEGGIKLVTSNFTSIVDSNLSENAAAGVVSNGVQLESVPEYQINSSIIQSNSGSGVISVNSAGSLSMNSISSNELDGITVQGNSEFSITNNTITENQRYGVSVTNESRGIVNYNQFTGNGLYGLFVEISTNDTINADFNYWGSEDGPLYQELSEGDRDGVFGNVEIDSILLENNQLQNYTPPLQVDFQLFFFILLGIFVVGGTTLFIRRTYVRRLWIRTTKPLALIITSRAGIPIIEYTFKHGLADTALISGFVSAIDSFAAEIVQDRGANGSTRKVREIQSKNNVILLTTVEDSFISMVVSNSNPLIIMRLTNFVNKLTNIAKYQKGDLMYEKLSNTDTFSINKVIEENFSDFDVDKNSSS